MQDLNKQVARVDITDINSGNMVLLANQAVLRHNYTNKDKPKELLTAEFVELFTMPHELTTYKEAITVAMFRGTKRNIESEEEPGKNQKAG